MRRNLLVAITLAAALALASLAAAVEPLPSWNEGQTKRAVVDFVQRVTTAGSADFVPVTERIAAFGNSDGDLQMLQWTTIGPGLRFGLIVHHTEPAGIPPPWK